jgi:hypothetical protein
MSSGRRKSPQSAPARGEMLISRMVLLIAILAAMLVVPLYIWKGDDNRAKEREAAELARTVAPPASAAQAAAAQTAELRNDPDRHGLSFGWLPHERLVHAACSGEPVDLDQPHRGGCNPYQGDSSCRKALPVLCARAGGAAGLELGTASPVAGFVLAGREAADAHCAQELGAGWRMASFHDGGGWALQGERSPGAPLDTRLRAWVFIQDQPGNCWDGKR